MKFKVGDRVIISKDLDTLIDDWDFDIIDEMLEFAGREAQITSIENNSYFIDIDHGKYYWHEELLTEVEA